MMGGGGLGNNAPPGTNNPMMNMMNDPNMMR